MAERKQRPGLERMRARKTRNSTGRTTRRGSEVRSRREVTRQHSAQRGSVGRR